MKRKWLVYGSAILGVIILGLASRRYGSYLPGWVSEYAGDTLWGVMLYLALGIVARTWVPWRLAVLTLAAAYGVEISQLYHAPWIDAVRHTRLGGLVLGYGFLWSDLACYTVGILAACTAESALTGTRRAGTTGSVPTS